MSRIPSGRHTMARLNSSPGFSIERHRDTNRASGNYL